MLTLSQCTPKTIIKHNSIAVIITTIITVTAISTAQSKSIIITPSQHKCLWHSHRSIWLPIIITLNRNSYKNNFKAILVITVGCIQNLNNLFRIHRIIIMDSNKRLIKRAMIPRDNCNSNSNSSSHC